jgi:hypothetical protein
VAPGISQDASGRSLVDLTVPRNREQRATHSKLIVLRAVPDQGKGHTVIPR